VSGEGGLGYDRRVDDARRLLKEGDSFLKAGEMRAALDRYAEVARGYAAAGFATKAIAIYLQIRKIVREHAPDARPLDDEARQKLSVLYRSVGLVADAVAIESEKRD
jgi:hypothetical protein